jgi:hypothetical protein
MDSTKKICRLQYIDSTKKRFANYNKELIFSEQYTYYQYKHASILVAKEATESITCIVLKKINLKYNERLLGK